jgi:RimJ/RimL family protein N-acetyltransferase
MVWPSEQPELVDDLVLLRGVRGSDSDAVFRACQDPDIQHFTQVPVPYPQSASDEFVALCAQRWRDGVTANFAVCGRVTGDFLGVMGVIEADHDAHTAGFGYWTALWGRGRHATSRAAALAAAWALGPGGLDVLTAEVEHENPASMRVLTHAGFTRLDVPDELMELKGTTRRFTTWTAKRDETREPGSAPDQLT